MVKPHPVATPPVLRHYAEAAADVLSIVFAALPGAGSLYVVTGLTRRATTMSLRWSAGRATRRAAAAAVGIACATSLALFWVLQGQFRGW
jgi:TRAP-type C4-dicarboxylate transport system permease small subunit